MSGLLVMAGWCLLPVAWSAMVAVILCKADKVAHPELYDSEGRVTR